MRGRRHRSGRVVVLTSVPVEHDRRESLAHFLASFFSEAESYTESKVNQVLQQVHEDFAALRRMMVDVGVMARDGHGVYVLSGRGI